MCAIAARPRCNLSSAVYSDRLPTLSKTTSARSVTRPFRAPVSSRSKVPPGGFGVDAVIPAICSALLL